MTVPDVTVVIPVYNRKRFLGEAIESVLAQDFDGDVEIVAVDDGSTDGSAAVAESYVGVRVVRQENRGPSAARNTGITAAAGRWLAFLDADDLMAPSKLRIQVGHLEAHPGVGCLLGRQETRHEGDGPTPAWLRRDPVYGDPGGISPVTAVLATETARRVGGFDERLRQWEGRDLLMRLRAEGVRIAVVDEVVQYRRVHDENVSHTMSDGRDALMGTLRATLRRRRRASDDSAPETDGAS